jgi:hypothetical protein
MANDVVPTGGSFLDELNLPKIVAGPAGEAIARLIGGAVDIPAAWLNRVAQGVKDKTEAKSVVSKAVADAAANLAKNDPEVVQRAAHALLSKELRHQTNREAIARKALENLSEDPGETSKVEDDWLNVFERYAEDASSERLQDLWGRILAGQLRRPTSFSLQTLRFVSELDEHMVSLFEKRSVRVIDADFIANPPKQGDEFTELIQLEDFGIVVGTTGNLSKTLSAGEEKDPPQTGRWDFKFKNHQIIIILQAPLKMTLASVLLTRVGREIYSITKSKGSLEPIKAFADYFPKHNIDQIICISDQPKTGEAPIILWSKPPPSPPQPVAPS